MRFYCSKCWRSPCTCTFYNAAGRYMTRCHADDDDYCEWPGCPQKRDGEPAKSGRHCPLDVEERK